MAHRLVTHTSIDFYSSEFFKNFYIILASLLFLLLLQAVVDLLCSLLQQSDIENMCPGTTPRYFNEISFMKISPESDFF